MGLGNRGRGLALALIAAAASCLQPAALTPLAAATISIPTPSIPTVDGIRAGLLAPDLAADPVLRFGDRRTEPDRFGNLLAEAIRRHPGLAEIEASAAEARAARSAARAGRLPSLDATMSSYRIVAREFSNDPNNIVERSRANRRTDASVTLSQTLFDFGAGDARQDAAEARYRAAEAGVESTADDIALRSVAVWYDVFMYRALVDMGQDFATAQAQAIGSVRERVRQGVSAEADVVRAESYAASAEAELARFRRSLASAEARFVELMGVAPPPSLGRAPIADGPGVSREAAELASSKLPSVRAAESDAEAAREDARAARADTRFNVAANVNAGRYGVFETDKDYDVRGTVTVRQRLFGGVDSRADEAEARARSAEARAARVREEARRDAAVAWTDVDALVRQLEALRASYVASRITRDVTVERFRIARGTLFDLLSTESEYFSTASAYIQGLGELDVARYVLLSRTGRLLAGLPIELPNEERRP